MNFRIADQPYVYYLLLPARSFFLFLVKYCLLFWFGLVLSSYQKTLLLLMKTHLAFLKTIWWSDHCFTTISKKFPLYFFGLYWMLNSGKIRIRSPPSSVIGEGWFTSICSIPIRAISSSIFPIESVSTSIKSWLLINWTRTWSIGCWDCWSMISTSALGDFLNFCSNFARSVFRIIVSSSIWYFPLLVSFIKCWCE